MTVVTVSVVSLSLSLQRLSLRPSTPPSSLLTGQLSYPIRYLQEKKGRRDHYFCVIGKSNTNETTFYFLVPIPVTCKAAALKPLLPWSFSCNHPIATKQDQQYQHQHIDGFFSKIHWNSDKNIDFSSYNIIKMPVWDKNLFFLWEIPRYVLVTQLFLALFNNDYSLWITNRQWLILR